MAIAVLVVFTVFKLWFERTKAGHWLHAQSHVWLQSKVQRDINADPPVVIVDISKLYPAEFTIARTNPATGKLTNTIESFTPRETLSNLIVRIASASPAAVGVDIDLSIEPELIPGTELLVATTNLFETALSLGDPTNNRPLPVFLGIKRNEALPPEQWLLFKRYVPLAASLARPKDDVHYMPYEFEFPGHLRVLPALARALVTTNVTPEPSPRWLRHFTKRVSVVSPVEDAPNFKFRKYPVDYAFLRVLEQKRVDYKSVLDGAAMSRAELSRIFSNKVVILGDATSGADTAKIASEPEPVPGIYIHASGVNTLLRAPLWELRTWIGLLLAFVCSMGSILLVYRVCGRFAERHQVTTVPLTILLTIALIALFVLAGVALARWLHILWLEMLAVCIVLLLDCLFDVLFGTMSWKHFKENPVKPFVVAEHEKE